MFTKGGGGRINNVHLRRRGDGDLDDMHVLMSNKFRKSKSVPTCHIQFAGVMADKIMLYAIECIESQR